MDNPEAPKNNRESAMKDVSTHAFELWAFEPLEKFAGARMLQRRPGCIVLYRHYWEWHSCRMTQPAVWPNHNIALTTTIVWCPCF